MRIFHRNCTAFDHPKDEKCGKGARVCDVITFKLCLCSNEIQLIFR